MPAAQGTPRGRVAASLLLSCRDQPGLVAAVAEFVFRHGGSILHADQHVDHEVGIFFSDVVARVAILASNQPHWLHDLNENRILPYGRKTVVFA